MRDRRQEGRGGGRLSSEGQAAFAGVQIRGPGGANKEHPKWSLRFQSHCLSCLSCKQKH